MLISSVDLGEAPGVSGAGDNGETYRVNDQVFEIFETEQNYEQNEFDVPTDVILLYKHIDISEATNDKPKRPNQYVETIVHEDDDTDLSDSYSNEDLYTVFETNEERLDILERHSRKSLCHKLEGINPTNDLTLEYQHFFKDPFVKEQLNKINTWPNSFEFSTILPTSLLDYICSKRYGDNYNFYMDNVISYVKHTIEQLKRISNGEFLTEKAKEKWLEVEGRKEIVENKMKVLATSSSIPKMKTDLSKWNNIVHSEIDIRSICKMLEKKIVLKVPKIISGSYNLFKPRDMTFSCKVEPSTQIKEVATSPRLDVLVHINQTDNVNNVSSIVILQVNHEPVSEPICIEALPYKEEPESHRSMKSSISIIEIDDNDDNDSENSVANEELSVTDEYMEVEEETSPESSNEAEVVYSDLFCPQEDVNGNELMVKPYGLSLSMHKLNMQVPLPEEVEETTTTTPPKKRSPTRVRIKSPYENKSHILEEKKRKKLLEIRERREKRKIAHIENSKMKKLKLNQAAVMPHASSSVTRLSITNKAFYNSIYGNSISSSKVKIKSKKELLLQIPNNSEDDEDFEKLPLSSPEHDKIKYVNRSYYLDDAITEVEKIDNVLKEEFSASSETGSEINNFLERLPTTPVTDRNTFTISLDATRVENAPGIPLKVPENPQETVPVLKKFPTKKEIERPQKTTKDIIKKTAMSLECRKSIDRIYELLKKISESDNSVLTNQKQADSESLEPENSILMGSDSGTSVKHHLTSNPSSFSIPNPARKKWEVPPTVVPKVIISSKQKSETKAKENNQSIRKKNTPADNIKSIKDNPLQAISQLLHDIDNVQKNRQKSAQETRLKSIRKIEAGDNKGVRRQVSFRKTSPTDLRDRKQSPEKRVPTPKRPKPPSLLEERILDRGKKLVDVEEAKEARGEAVKGPKQTNFSRMNALAQPRKSYILAHNEEIKTRFGKSIVTERLQRLVDTPASAVDKQNTLIGKKPRRHFDSLSSIKTPAVAPPGSPGRRPPGSPERRLPKPSEGSGDVTKKQVARRPRSRRSSPEPALPPRPVRVSRVPLVPDDEIPPLRTPSPQEDSTKLGDRLHQIISRTIMIANRPTHPADLEIKKSVTKDLFIIKESVSTTQDFPVDIFADKTVLTAVEAVTVNEAVEDVKDNNKLKTKSILDLQALESALYSQMCSGDIQKRLRIKNFTLTPKHSMSQILLLQSGDHGNLFSKTVKLSASKSDTSADLKCVPVFSKTRLDFAAKIPMQVATVGYAFPKYGHDVKTKITELPESTEDVVKTKPVRPESTKHVVKTNEVSPESTKDVVTDKVVLESTSELSVIATAHSCPSNPKSDFTFAKKAIDKITHLESEGDTVTDTDENEDKESVKETLQKINEEVDGTNSLDILVKLLSEIQNITTKQTDITKIASCKDLQITNDTKKAFRSALANSARDIVSLTSLEQMRQLDSSPSLYSFYLSSEDEREIRRVQMLVPYYEDKGVSVDIRRELVNNFTNVPSSLFPAVCRSTNISESLYGILKSTQSTSTFSRGSIEQPFEYENLYSNVLLETPKSILESVELLKNDMDSDDSKSSIVVSPKKVVKRDKQEATSIKIVQTESTVGAKIYEAKGKELALAHDFTPVMKAKRDILVTVYSLLVLTVFAALSFPGVVYS